MHLDIIKVLFYSPIDAQMSCLKNDFNIYIKININFGTEVLHLIQINHQPDATIFQFIILTFV